MMENDEYVLITGGLGFIGSNLVRDCINKGYNVIIIDNCITGSLKNIDTLPIEKMCIYLNDINTDFYKIGNDKFLKSLFNTKKIKFIFHLASIASPFFYKKFPLETLSVGSIGTKNIFDMVLKYDRKIPILISSTSEVYGDPLIKTQNESYYGNVNCYGERSCYDESKRFMESLAYTYNNKYNMNIKIARIFNTYGENMMIKDGRVIPNFIYQSLNNIPHTIFGNGKQTRSFCYIDDMIDGLWRLIKSDLKIPVNLGNPDNEYIINNISEIISDLLHSDIKPIYLPLSENDPLVRHPDIDIAINNLDWYPKTNIIEGLKKTIKYFEKHVNK